jgi:hypothetical protein
MDLSEERNQLIVQTNNEFSPTMMDFEQKMMSVYQVVGLPIDDILVPVNERRKVFKNFMDVLEYVPRHQLECAHFITKFMTAASVGLFDSALNHLWVETIKQLKTRILQYDIDYFFDVAVPSERRDEFSVLEDLDKVDEVQLLEGARRIELLTEKGYKQLDHIRYMLGYMERESGNQSEISGTMLISWLEVCIKEVITLEIPSDSIQAQILLRRIREGVLTQDDVNGAIAFISGMSVKYANVFAKGIFGLYLRQDTSPHIIMNIKSLMPTLWGRIDVATKNEFATAYAIYSVNEDKEKAKLARAFISIVGGEEYLPDNVRGYEIKITINQLLSMHRGANNFYNEPEFARQVERLVGKRKVPTKIDRDYVLGIVDVFLTNGNGVCWAGNEIYTRLINKFTESQTFIAATSFNEERISNKLSRPLCADKFREMLTIIAMNASSQPLIEFVDYLQKYKGGFENLSKDSSTKRKVSSLRLLY